MKKVQIILGLTIGLLTSVTSFAGLPGKNVCKAFFPLEKGTELTYENYSAKDKLESTDKLRVDDVIEEADRLTIKIHASTEEKKGEVQGADFEYYCENGVFKMSMESLIDQEMMEAYKDMDIEVKQNELALPSDMSVGASLPDADMEIVIKSNGMQIMTMSFHVVDRKVEAFESITTAAGTFECFKLSQTTKSKMMFMNLTLKSIDWIAEGIGSVRSESYTEKGKLEGYTVLTNIKH